MSGATGGGRSHSKPSLAAMFETKSHSWQEAGLAQQLAQSRREARRARVELLVLIPLIVAVVLVDRNSDSVFGDGRETLSTLVVTGVLLALGMVLARDLGRLLGPALFRRLDPGTAGTVGFIVRLLVALAAFGCVLAVAGAQTETLAVGTAATAVVLGLAAQQTLGNLFAGMVILSSRPYRVGDRVRFKSGPLAGEVEGVVSSLGLLHTSLASGEDHILVPNRLVLDSAIIPLREPDAVDLLARVAAGTKLTDLQLLLERHVSVPVRARPEVALEEVDGDEVVVRITATPVVGAEGGQLADQVLAALETVTVSAEA